MDPVTGLVALTGITLASLAGLRLKQQQQGSQEGFEVLPNKQDGYPDSVTESQSRYNMLTGMVNPLKNGIIPVDSSETEISSTRNLVRGALGGERTKYGKQNSFTLNTEFKHSLVPRADGGEKSIFGLMKFCRAAGELPKPFSELDGEGNPKAGEDGRREKEGSLKIFKDANGNEVGRFDFDQHCGICLTGGADEEGNKFVGRKGMVMDQDSREAAYSIASSKGYPYPRAKPPVGTCIGAPEEPNFALNQKDLERYEKRLYCLKRKQIDPEHQCGICYENDVYSYVENGAALNEMAFVLQGIGKAQIYIREVLVQEIILDDTKTQKVPLLTDSGISAKEGDSFRIAVNSTATPSSSNTDTINSTSSLPIIYGYFQGINPNGGIFVVPLNMLAVVDGITGSSPNKAGGFYTFSSENLEVAKMRPGVGARPPAMNLKGTIPFTFVSGSEFSAIDCPAAPYQMDIKSASAFATDQPCFVKGAKPGKYNDECLRQRILDAGCTNQGSLYKDPKVLNTDTGLPDGKPQSLTEIYNKLADIRANDMIDPDKTKQCSGRKIETPCDPFIANPDLKFGTILASSGNPGLKTQAAQCLSYLYNNKGANEPGPVPRVGPTYSGIVTYANNRKEAKKIYCIPDGDLNPDKTTTAQNTLAQIADMGFQRKTGVEAVKAYLDTQQQLAVDMTRNANTDPRRKEAIRNCFGRNLSALPTEAAVDPEVISNPCGEVARYIQVIWNKPWWIDWYKNWYSGQDWFTYGDNYNLTVSQVVVFNGAGTNIALNKSAELSDEPIAPGAQGRHDKAFITNGKLYSRRLNNYKTKGTSIIVDLGEEMDVARVAVIVPPNAGYKNLYVAYLDSKKEVIKTQWPSRDSDYNTTYYFDALLDAPDANCKLTKVEAVLPTPVALPAGYQQGWYMTYYNIEKSDPSIQLPPGSAGWGTRAAPPNVLRMIQMNDWITQSSADYYNNYYKSLGWGDYVLYTPLPKEDRIGVVASAYVYFPYPGTIRFYVGSDDGTAIYFNNELILNMWNLQGTTYRESKTITVNEPGLYPVKVMFYEWEGGATFDLYYSVSDEMTEDSGLRRFYKDRIYYSTAEAEQDSVKYEQWKKQREDEDKQRFETAKQRVKEGKIILKRKPWNGQGYNDDNNKAFAVFQHPSGMIWYVGKFPGEWFNAWVPETGPNTKYTGDADNTTTPDWDAVYNKYNTYYDEMSVKILP